jgi:hypothetical protein
MLNKLAVQKAGSARADADITTNSWMLTFHIFCGLKMGGRAASALDEAALVLRQSSC